MLQPWSRCWDANSEKGRFGNSLKKSNNPSTIFKPFCQPPALQKGYNWQMPTPWCCHSHSLTLSVVSEVKDGFFRLVHPRPCHRLQWWLLLITTDTLRKYSFIFLQEPENNLLAALTATFFLYPVEMFLHNNGRTSCQHFTWNISHPPEKYAPYNLVNLLRNSKMTTFREPDGALRPCVISRNQLMITWLQLQLWVWYSHWLYVVYTQMLQCQRQKA